MTKRRDPDSWAGAAWRAKEILGAEVIAAELQALGAKIRVQTVYDWTDPDSGSQPVFWQGEVMDRLCADKTGETPFLDALARRVKRGGPTGACLMRMALDMDKGTAALAETVHKALADGKVSDPERDDISEHVAVMERACGRMRAELGGTVATLTTKQGS